MLIIAMFLAGIATGLGCTSAHRKMVKRTYLTPIPNYGVGVLCALIPWSLAIAPALLTPTPEVIAIIGIGIWYVFGCGGLATWLAYEKDRPSTTEADVHRFIPFIAGEHDETERGD